MEKVKVNCPDCNLEITKSKLKDHQFRFHNGNQRLFQCTLCDKNYKTSGDLLEHTKIKHSATAAPKPKPKLSSVYMCEMCHAFFDSPRTLKHHQTIEHHVACPHCDLKFTTTSGFLSHLTTEHRHACTFACTVCEVDKSTSEKVRSHMLKHHKHDIDALKSSKSKVPVSAPAPVPAPALVPVPAPVPAPVDTRKPRARARAPKRGLDIQTDSEVVDVESPYITAYITALQSVAKLRRVVQANSTDTSAFLAFLSTIKPDQIHEFSRSVHSVTSVLSRL